jgi:hypothetical protein
MKKYGLILILCLLGAAFGSQYVVANGRPLPPMPSSAVTGKVIAQTTGLPFIPLGAPRYVVDKLTTFSGVLDNVETKVDLSQTIHYIKTNRQLTEAVLPLKGSGQASLTPDMTTPGINPRPGKIVGAFLQPSRGTRDVMVIVAVFKPESATCPSCYPPEKIRFYYNSTQYYEYSIIWGKFTKGKDKFDDGAVVAHKYSCVTVGLEQVCWEPYDHNIIRDEPAPKDIAYEAYTAFKNVYSIGVDFYVDDAVPDLVGEERRNACAAAMPTVTSFNDLPACKPNLVFTAAKERKSGQPIGIFVVLETADIKTYRASDGAYIGGLPAGKYLVLDATPGIQSKGAIAALFLVNLDTTNHYLIPSRVMAGFSESSAIAEPQAAIKDGYLWSRGFGYP